MVADAAGVVPSVLMEVAGEGRTEAEDARADAGVGACGTRAVSIVNAGAKKVLELRVEVPVEDMAKLGEIQDQPA